MADPSAPVPTLTVSTAVSDIDHSKLVELAGWLCMVVGILCTLARVQIRWPLNALAGIDDVLCGIATALTVIQTAVVLHATRIGFGVTEAELQPRESATIAKTIYATDLLFTLSLWLGRVSVTWLLTRLAGESNKSKYTKILSLATAVLGLVAFLIIVLRQDISHPWSYTSASESSTDVRWIANGVLGILADLAAMGMSWYLVRDLQMGSQPKTLVITAFVLRGFAFPIIILRLVALSRVQADDFSFSYALPEIYTQLEMHCNIIATTLPCLRMFLSAWNTSFMNMGLEELDPQAYQEHVSSHTRSYALRSMNNKRSKASASASRQQHSNSGWMVPDSHHGRSTAYIETGRQDEDNASDKSTRAIVVKQTVTVD